MFSTAGVDNPGLVCKSAHAGSIPASASTFESPADLGGVLIQASHMTADTRDNIDW